jgi:hypothetical protein
MNDVDILDRVKQSLPEVHMTTPLEEVVDQGRTRRRRRRSRLAGGGLVAAVALAISLGAFEATRTTPSPGRASVLKLGHSAVHIQLAGYSINSNTDGTVTIRFTDEQSMNPTYMQQVLAKAGVPALIRIGSFCHTPTQPSGFEVSDRQGPQGNVMVITPSAMPAGAELSIGYFSDQVAWTMIAIGQPLSCVTSDP